jgi:putative aldouronate transport system substrate-binding protein
VPIKLISTGGKYDMKKLLAIMLMVVMIVSFASCVQKDKQSDTTDTTTAADTDSTTGEIEPAILFDEPVKITIMAPYHDSWPFQEDWYVLDLIKRKANVTLVMDAVASTGWIDKYNITMASTDLPDIIWDFTAAQANTYGPEGAFVNILDHMDKLPNFRKFNEQCKASVISNMSDEGALYSFPIYGIGNTNLRGWLYRKDIFDKHNISLPTNENEFYNVLKQLKGLYPESYPLTFRENLTHFKMAATAWGTCNTEYYDWDEKVWKFGPSEENFKDMLAYYKKLYEEELIPMDWHTLTAQQWTQIVTTSNAFLTLDYIARVDTFGNPMRDENPEVDFRYMPPPAFGKNGQQKLRFSCESNTVMSPCAGKNQENTLKFLDWMYSDEGKDILSWGEEGVTYEIVNGERRWKPIEGVEISAATLRQKYGLSTNGMYLFFDYNSHAANFSPQLKEADTLAQKYQDTQIPIVALNQEEDEIDKTKGLAIRDHYRANAAKFILGERPLEEFDAYVQELKELGLNDYLNVLGNAFKRQTGS